MQALSWADLVEPPWVCFLGVIGVFLYLTMIIATAKIVWVWDGNDLERDFTSSDVWGLFVITGIIWPITWFIRGAFVLGRVIVRGILRVGLPKPELPHARVISDKRDTK